MKNFAVLQLTFLQKRAIINTTVDRDRSSRSDIAQTLQGKYK